MNTSSNTTRITIAVIVLAILGLIAYSIYQSTGPSIANPNTPGSATSSTVTIATSSVASISAKTSSGSGSYTIKAIPVSNRPTAPNYKEPLVFAASVNPEFRAALINRLATVQAAIAKDAYDFNSWISLGTIHYMAGNTAAARDIWEYTSKVWPTNVVSHNNLGDLYMGLKDYIQAESNFLAAIKNKPDDTNPYRNLFTMYSSVYKKGTAAAEDILKKGIAANPKAVDMQVLLARYYRDNGRTTDAKAEYSAAITNAQGQGQASLATDIEKEKDAF